MKWTVGFYDVKVANKIHEWPPGIQAKVLQTEKTPAKELEIARRCMQEVLSDEKKSRL